MSEWYEVENQDDVELSDDKKTLEVWFKANYNGNVYIEIPIEFVKNALKE